MDKVRPKKKKHVIGWTEFVDLPEWSIRRVKAKIDTGARSSALHVEDLEILSDKQLQFRVVGSKTLASKNRIVVADIEKRAKVRSSNGKYSYRYFVRTPIKIGPITKEISVSLVSRENMLFRMLIGRKALEKHFLIDVNKRSSLTARKKKKSVAKKAKKS